MDCLVVLVDGLYYLIKAGYWTKRFTGRGLREIGSVRCGSAVTVSARGEPFRFGSC